MKTYPVSIPEIPASVARVAEILLPGIDRGGKPARIATSFGPKTRTGLADLIAEESGFRKLRAALQMVQAVANDHSRKLMHGGYAFYESEMKQISEALKATD